MNDKVHLLLIDDEKNYLLVLETLLTEAGYAVTALNDPETALAFLEESEVDIVITDMKMPRISGREVLERVKKNWPHIPVLIMTAFPRPAILRSLPSLARPQCHKMRRP